jgi:beta-glucosidase
LTRALSEHDKISLLEGDQSTLFGGPATHTGVNDGIPELGVPTINFTDGRAGIRQGRATALPVPLAIGATFDPALARQFGGVVGVEARDKGNEVFFGPTLEIVRTPLWGRTFEVFGEDPLLTSLMGVSEIEGVQSKHVIANANILAANTQEGYSPDANQSRPGQSLGPSPTEGSRYMDNAVVSARTLREVYLPPFEAAVKTAHVGSVMCAYNSVNGVPSCQNRYLLIDALRGWGFDGFTVSDYGATHSTVASLRNGLDEEPWPPGGIYSPANVEKALAGGQVTPAIVNTHVWRYLRTLFAFGVFDRKPFVDNPHSIPRSADARIAERLEEAAATLLVDRRRVLPLNPHHIRSIAILGAGANRFLTGGGSSLVNPLLYTTVQAAVLRHLGPNVRARIYTGPNPARAATLARRSQVAIVVTPNYQTEGVDRLCLTLECPSAYGDQDTLIRRVADANRRTIVVLETGGPVLTPWRGRVAGLLEAWYPGEEGGAAIARVLFGNVDPGGRLPVTFPASEAKTPTAGDPESYPGVDNRTSFSEGVLVGYRWYEAHHNRPAFPFGFGLSYTRFRYQRLQLKTPRGRTRVLHVSLTVANVGPRAGTAVPQLYVHVPPPRRNVLEPPRQLRGFDHIVLRRGESRRVTFTLTARDLAWWDTGAHSWRVATGCYKIFVGSSSQRLPLSATVAVGDTRCHNAAAELRRPSSRAAASSLL